MQDRLKKQSSAVLIIICLVFIAGVKLILSSFASEPGTVNEPGNKKFRFQPSYFEKTDTEHYNQTNVKSQKSHFNIIEKERTGNIKSEAEKLGTKLFQLYENSGKKNSQSGSAKGSGEITREIFWTLY